MTTRRASTRLLALSRLLDNLAELYPDTIEHLDRQLAGIDSYPKHTPGAAPETATARINTCRQCEGHGCDECAPGTSTATEAAALARVRHSQILDDLSAGIKLAEVTIHDLVNTCHHELRSRSINNTLALTRICDCSGREGALVPLDEGGWSDPTCRDHATKAGLCGRCYFRERRWRIANALPTRHDNAA